jgi:DNA-directed RNA polymerase subunit M/transcription elongation factor TFIIS
MKTKKCIKCGVQLHPTDWIILKEMNTLPICDNCSLDEEKNNNELLQNKINKETSPPNKKIIRFPK